MRIGAALFLIAVGAVLKFAVDTKHTHGFDLGTVGVILMIVGVAGLVIELVVASMRRRTDIVHRSPAGTSRTTYEEPSDIDPRY
jgi:membrane-bound ClpP family serine protease